MTDEQNKWERRARYQSEALKKQVGGDHYKTHSIQPIEVIQEYGLSFACGNAVKYVLRTKDSAKLTPRAKRIEDLEKAKHYLELEIGHLKGIK